MRSALILLLAATSVHAQTPDLPAGEGRISGRILTSTSAPIAGATILLGLNDTNEASDARAWWVVTSDHNGVYEFAGLPSGRFALVAARDGYAGWASVPAAAPAPTVAWRPFPALALAVSAPRATIELVPGGWRSEVNFTLYEPASISGRAVNPDGSAAVRERVMLHRPDDAGTLSGGYAAVATDAGGRYVFSDLRPGTYYVGPWQPGRLQDLERAGLIPISVSEGMSLTNVDVPTVSERGFSIRGRVVDTLGQVPRAVQIEYGVAGATHRGLLSVSSADGRFQLRDPGIAPGPLTMIGRGENDEGPLIGVLTLMAIDGPNEVEVVVGKPGGVRGRVSLAGGIPVTAIGVRLTLVREGFAPLDAADHVIDVAPDGWFEAGDLLGEYRVRVDEPQRWTVQAVRRRGLRIPNDRIVVGNAEILDDLEIVSGPR